MIPKIGKYDANHGELIIQMGQCYSHMWFTSAELQALVNTVNELDELMESELEK